MLVAKAPREPSGVRQIPQSLRDGFPSQLHRAIGHQDVDRFIGIPDVEIGIERPKPLRVVTNGLYEEARLARFAPAPTFAPNAQCGGRQRIRH
jgi:hypothetical protein